MIVDREGRTNNFSRDFGLPEEVKAEFRRLGFVVGRDKTPGLEIAIGGNTGGQSIVSAELGAWSIKGTVTNNRSSRLELTLLVWSTFTDNTAHMGRRGDD